MNRVVLLLLIVVLLFQESDAIFGKKRKEREEAERTAKEDVNLGMDTLEENLSDPEAMIDTLDLLKDPAIRAEVEAMQRNPAFVKEMERMRNDPKFEQRLKDVAMLAAKARPVGADLLEAQEVLAKATQHKNMATLAKAATDPAAIKEAMDLLNDPTKKAQLQEMMKDPRFLDQMKTYTQDPSFKAVYESAKQQMNNMQQNGEL
jgi:hypothetical protein